MTKHEFYLALHGDPVRSRKDGIRLRVKVADELSAFAEQLRSRGHDHKAHQMIYVEERVRLGRELKKGALGQLAAELDEVAILACDGNAETDW